MGGLTPIVLNEFGDTILEYDPNPGKKHRVGENDALLLGCVIGVHETCNAIVHLLDSSKTHRVIHCQRCHLRIPIPVEINTYAKLRKWCAEKRDPMSLSHGLAFEPGDRAIETSRISKPRPGVVSRRKNRDSILD